MRALATMNASGGRPHDRTFIAPQSPEHAGQAHTSPVRSFSRQIRAQRRPQTALNQSTPARAKRERHVIQRGPVPRIVDGGDDRHHTIPWNSRGLSPACSLSSGLFDRNPMPQINTSQGLLVLCHRFLNQALYYLEPYGLKIHQ